MLELMPVIKKERENSDVEEVAVSPHKPKRKENGQSNGAVRKFIILFYFLRGYYKHYIQWIIVIRRN